MSLERPAPPDPETVARLKRDAQELAKIRAMDSKAGTPSEDTLRRRFASAVLNGYTGVIKDTLAKGYEMPEKVFFAIEKQCKVTVEGQDTLSIPVLRQWADMVEVLAPKATDDSLAKSLAYADVGADPAIAKMLRTQFAKRLMMNAAPDTAEPLTRLTGETPKIAKWTKK